MLCWKWRKYASPSLRGKCSRCYFAVICRWQMFAAAVCVLGAVVFCRAILTKVLTVVRTFFIIIVFESFVCCALVWCLILIFRSTQYRWTSKQEIMHVFDFFPWTWFPFLIFFIVLFFVSKSIDYKFYNRFCVFIVNGSLPSENYPAEKTGMFRVSSLSQFRVSCLSQFRVSCLSPFRVSCLSQFRVSCLSQFRVSRLIQFTVSCLSQFRVSHLNLWVSCLSLFRVSISLEFCALVCLEFHASVTIWLPAFTSGCCISISSLA